MDIHIDKASDNPVYRQVIEKIAALIRNGELKPGDKLPPERELADRLSLARGTVNKAYEELTRSELIESIPGRGSFVSAKQDVMETGRKERAVQAIANLVDELRGLRFSYREIRTLVELGIMEKEKLFDELAIAVVDCNPEAMAGMQLKLNVLSRMPVTRILLDDLAASGDANRRLPGFDLVLTTARHYSEVLGMAAAAKDKIVQVALSPSQETIIALASVKPGRRLGIVCESRQFSEIIRGKLKDLMITGEVAELRGPDQRRLAEFLAVQDDVIVPPLWQAPSGKEAAAAVQEFTGRGGRFIVFDYQVERGSMIYVEERIRDLLST